jgi:hypothetical protein
LLDRPPAEALAHLDSVVDGTAAHTAAATYLLLEGATESVTVTGAGYGTVVIVTPDGTTQIVGALGDGALGAAHRPHPSLSLPFPLGSSLLLHAHTPGCPSSGPTEDVLRAEVTEARLFARGRRSQGPVCESLARALRCDDERDESVVLLGFAEEGELGDTPSRHFTGQPDSAAAARAFTLRTMDDWLLGQAANRAAAIVGELAANAIQHAATPFEVRLHRHPDAVTLEVFDGDRELPRAVDAGSHQSGHRGLLIVETLADRWGVRFTEHGKVVWAELRLDVAAGGERLG